MVLSLLHCKICCYRESQPSLFLQNIRRYSEAVPNTDTCAYLVKDDAGIPSVAGQNNNTCYINGECVFHELVNAQGCSQTFIWVEEKVDLFIFRV